MFNWRAIHQLMILIRIIEEIVADMRYLSPETFEAIFDCLLIPSLKIVHWANIWFFHIGFPGPSKLWCIWNVEFKLIYDEVLKEFSIRIRDRHLTIRPKANRYFPSMLGEDHKVSTAYALELSRVAIGETNRAMEEADAALRQRFEQSMSGKQVFHTEKMVEAFDQTLGWVVAEVVMLRSVLTYLESIDPPVFYVAPGISYPRFSGDAVFLNQWEIKEPIINIVKTCQEAAREYGVEETECIRGAVKTAQEIATWVAYHRIQATDAMKAEMKILASSPLKDLLRDFLLGVFGALRAWKILKYPNHEDAFLKALTEAVETVCLARGQDFSWFWLPPNPSGTGHGFPSIVRSGGLRKMEVFPFDPCEFDRIARKMSEDIQHSSPEERVRLLLDLWRMFGEIAEKILSAALPLPGE